MVLRKALLFLGLVCIAHQVQAQKVSDKKVIKELKKDIGYLASDELKGRRTGSEGEKLAANYIIQHYTEEGIAAYKGKVYQHPFSFVAGRAIANTTRISINSNVLTKEDGFPLAFSGNGQVHEDVIPDIIESGKVCMLPMYETQEDADNPHFDWEKAAYERAEEAKKNGAVGVVFYDSYKAKFEPFFNKRNEYEPLSIPVAFMTIKGYVKYIVSDNESNMPSIQVDMNINLKDKKMKGNNIVAYIDNNAEHTVVLGAHYDHLGLGQDGNSRNTDTVDKIHNGADDNASGTAALMHLASWLKDSDLKKYNYMFIHFSAEELGLIGSKKVVEELDLDGSKIAYMMNMDMVGRLNDSTHALTVGGIGTSPVWPKAVNLKDENFKIVVDSSGVGPSDHTSFYHKDIPVLFFFTGTHTDYHKPSDDADKINYEGEVAIMHYMYDIIANMNKMPKPEFTKTKQTSVGRVRFKVTLGVMPDYAFNDGGLRIDGVTDGRPASNAGIKAGDIVIQIGEHEILGIQTYMKALAAFEEGDKTQVTVKRDGKEITMPLTFTPKD